MLGQMIKEGRLRETRSTSTDVRIQTGVNSLREKHRTEVRAELKQMLWEASSWFDGDELQQICTGIIRRIKEEAGY
jgi:hypothetical protein